jgi:hypothetical protein
MTSIHRLLKKLATKNAEPFLTKIESMISLDTPKSLTARKNWRTRAAIKGLTGPREPNLSIATTPSGCPEIALRVIDLVEFNIA